MALLDNIKSLLGGKLNVSSRFALLREAIQGTMSQFYMARDLRSGQIVGLKLLDPAKLEAVEARFKGLNKPCEGEISLKLSHPRIVTTFEHGLTTDNRQYIVMEFLEGPDLNSLIVGRSSLLDGRRLDLVRQAAEAVAAVHAAGFIHRDICPRNLLLADGKRNLKLIDFGLTVPATKPFMQPGNRTGTPNYMAPEIVRRKPTDQRLDVFALGVTAYEICTGELPWARGTTGLAAMSHDKPPMDIRHYRPRIQPALAKAIHACLAAERTARPTVEQFLRAIKEIPGEDQ